MVEDPQVGAFSSGSEPVAAQSRTIRAAVAPIAYNCVKFIVVRDGSALLFSEFGERAVSAGDVVLLSPNVLCGSEPEGSITVTTLYLNHAYLLSQFFWQHSPRVADQFEAKSLLTELYAEPAHVLRLGEDRVGLMSPWLDELVSLSIDGLHPTRFYRAQALLFAILDVIVPHIEITAKRKTGTQRRLLYGDIPLRGPAPLRAEVLKAADLLRNEHEHRWTLSLLAAAVNLSESQLVRVFTEAYGQSPLTFLTMVRTENLAQLLRESDLSVEAAIRKSGWTSRGHAARLFREHVGVTPSEYRTRVWTRQSSPE